MPGDRTASVHGPDPPARGSLTTPIHQTTTFALDDADDVDALYEGRRSGDVYSRYSNPSVSALERRLAQLERTDEAVALASGMGAVSSVLFAFVPAGGRVVANADLYGGTVNLFKLLRERFNVRVDLVPTMDAAAFARALAESADLVYVESPTNPTIRLADIEAVARAARAAGAPSVVDSTFASPMNSRPHELGADLVLHSLTKYLSGHADVTAGAVCGPRALVTRVRGVAKLMGPTLDPHAAYLVERGLKTLPLRVQASNVNAMRVAEALESNPAVRAVHYPGLASSPQHALATRQMPGGCGGVLSFDLASLAQAKRFLDALRVVRNAASLGGVESLCSIPYQQSHRGQPKAALDASGIREGTVRLAIGIEDGDDLVADIEQAIAAAVR